MSVGFNYWWNLCHSCKESCVDAENIENLQNNENHLCSSILTSIILRERWSSESYCHVIPSETWDDIDGKTQ